MTDCSVVFSLFASTNGPQWANSFGWNQNMTEGLACCFSFGIGCSNGKVTSIDLSGNNLQGVLPDIFGELDFLKSLDLSENKLTGPIPASLEELLDAATLDLRNNLFTGPVPKLGFDPSAGGTCQLEGNSDLSCVMDPEEACTFGRQLPPCVTPGAGAIGSVSQNSIAPAVIDDDDDDEEAVAAPAVGAIGSAAGGAIPNLDELTEAVEGPKANLKAAAVAYPDDPNAVTPGQDLNANPAPEKKSGVPLGAIIGGAVGLLVVGTVTPAAYLAIRRRRAAAAENKDGYESAKSDDAATPTPKKMFGSVKVGSSKSKTDIPSSFERGSSREISQQLATSNVRRFNVDGAYPGMPGFRDEDDKPAFTPSRRGSAMSVSSELSDDSSTAPSRRASGRTFQLKDPIMERASEDLARDLEEAGVARASDSPYGGAKDEPAAKPSALGFFSRMMGSARNASAPVPSDEEAGTPPQADPASRSTAVEGVTAFNGSLDAKSLYSHQTQHEIREGLVQQVKSTSPSASTGSYTGFTAPGSSAAKRAANKARKGKGVPNVVPTRSGSL
ncbi:hypothetical protein HDU96_003796 [Phlyctochytrium bullatum]|nr:hypothetical protein HDU96_003796 [Phlyctochytrium bullatum]